MSQPKTARSAFGAKKRRKLSLSPMQSICAKNTATQKDFQKTVNDYLAYLVKAGEIYES
jgi:hypothetical protein